MQETVTVINFAHPITSEQESEIQRIVGLEHSIQIVNIPTQLDHEKSFREQVRDLVDRVGFNPEEWQTRPIIVNLPGFSPAAALVVAELHGRMGHFASIIRLRPVAGATPPRFEVAEILNLQEIRESARTRRFAE